ncbi:MAG: RNA methyltransferase [Opitutales bacterium]
MSETILSLKNPSVKGLVKLHQSARHRREMGRFPVEGFAEIEAGLAAKTTFTEAYFSPAFFRDRTEQALLRRLEATGATVTELGKDAFAKVAYREHPDGLLAVAETWELKTERLSLGPNPLVLVLDEIEKPGNLGGILRTADALGVVAVLLADPALDFFNPNVLRASRGLSLSVPVAAGTKEETFDYLLKNELRILGASAKNPAPLWEADLTGASAIILGSEREGLGPFWRERLDEALVIPMCGTADSLNVSVVAACFISEAERQRRGR